MQTDSSSNNCSIRNMNPREKKAKDLASHCKNRYGNNDKAARNGIRRFKRESNQKIRRSCRVQAGDIANCESDTFLDTPKPYKKKWPDTPMGDVLAKKIEQRIRAILPSGDSESFFDSFKDYCIARGMNRHEVSAWCRYLRGEMTIGIIPLPKLELRDTARIEETLKDFMIQNNKKANKTLHPMADNSPV
jgi:hypothetical protein